MSFLTGTFERSGVGLQEATWARLLGFEAPSTSTLSISDARLGVDVLVSGATLDDTRRRTRVLLIGEDFSGSTLASSLAERYLVEGIAALRSLNGCSAGMILDEESMSVHLFNDRFGLKRIYYRDSGEALSFSTCARHLLARFPASRMLRRDSVADVFSVGCVMRGESLFPDIRLLPPGSVMSSAKGGPWKLTSYFDAQEWEDQAALSATEFHEALKETFHRVVPRYTSADAQVAMSLTGGLDGRVLMGWSGRAAGELPCYSFGGMYRDSHDVRIASQVAAVCGQTHEVIETGRDFLDQFDYFARGAVRESDGSMDVSGAVELYVNRHARRIAPIRMTGNYGSEIMRSNVAFRPRRWPAGLFDQDMLQRMQQSEAVYEKERKVRDLSFIAFKQLPWHHYARSAVEKAELTIHSPFLDNEVVGLMYRAPLSMTRGADAALRLVHAGNPALAYIPTDRGLAFGESTWRNRLRHALSEFSAKAEYAYDYGMPRTLATLDHRLEFLGLERLFLGRHKFYHFRIWYRTRLAEYARGLLLGTNSSARNFFAPGVVEKVVESHTSGRENHTLALHRMLSLELTHQEVLAKPTASVN